jgi:dephospho-CoA kinase
VQQVALTGGIATGKSYCLARFGGLGAPTIDADRLARLAVAPGSPGLAAVSHRFGAAVVRADGTLDRAALAKIVFADRIARTDLEAIVHPEVYRRIREWFAQLPFRTPLAIADIPLLFETGHEHDFDAVVVAACSPEEQLRRLVARDGLSEADAQARLAAQSSIEEKVRRAHYVIRTDGGFAATDAEIARVYRSLGGQSPLPGA